MSESLILAVFFGLLLCCAMCVYRIGRGPTAPDRMVAIEILGTLVVGFAVLLAAATGRDYFMNVAIVLALVSFVGSIALAKHLEGRGFDE